MNVLLVEDDDLKFELLSAVIKQNSSSHHINRAASYQSGIEKLVRERFDLVLLDMSLPVSDLEFSPVGMDWLNFGGQFVLRECSRKKISARIIVVSQYKTFVRDNEEVSFERLKEEIMTLHNDIVIKCVHLDRSSDNWRREILETLL